MNSAPDTLQREHLVVRALCCAAAIPSARATGIRLLAAYGWAGPEHRIVYEALREARDCDVAALREHLPALAARAGFPDVHWPDYFRHDPGCECGKQIEELVMRVTGLKTATG